MKILDVSRQSTGFAITEDQFRRAKADGYGGVIVGLHDGVLANPYAGETLANARRAGLLTGGYAALAAVGPAAHNPGLVIGGARDAAGQTEWAMLSFVSVDCELDGITTDDVRTATNLVLTLRQRPVIYTAYWWWVGHFGNPTNFSDLPLWCAFYDGDPDYDFPAKPFGGWTVDIGEQYLGTQTFSYGGQEFGADINVFRDDFVNSGPGSQAGLVALKAAWDSDIENSIRAIATIHQGPISPYALALYAIDTGTKAHNWARIVGPGK